MINNSNHSNHFKLQVVCQFALLHKEKEFDKHFSNLCKSDEKNIERILENQIKELNRLTNIINQNENVITSYKEEIYSLKEQNRMTIYNLQKEKDLYYTFNINFFSLSFKLKNQKEIYDKRIKELVLSASVQLMKDEINNVNNEKENK